MKVGKTPSHGVVIAAEWVNRFSLAERVCTAIQEVITRTLHEKCIKTQSHRKRQSLMQRCRSMQFESHHSNAGIHAFQSCCCLVCNFSLLPS